MLELFLDNNKKRPGAASQSVIVFNRFYTIAPAQNLTRSEVLDGVYSTFDWYCTVFIKKIAVVKY